MVVTSSPLQGMLITIINHKLFYFSKVEIKASKKNNFIAHRNPNFKKV